MFHFCKHITSDVCLLPTVKRHVEEKPTPELLMELVDRNLSYHQQTFIGVVAHEIGHLLGAPEV